MENNTEEIINIINMVETNLDKLKKIVNYDKSLLENNRLEKLKELLEPLKEEISSDKELELSKEKKSLDKELELSKEEKSLSKESYKEGINLDVNKLYDQEDKKDYMENSNLITDTNSEDSTELLDKEDEELLKNAKIDFLYNKNTKKNINKKIQSKKNVYNNEMKRGLEF